MQRFLHAVLAVTLGVSGAAFASSSGQAGYSGKSGAICNQCHSGGTTPTVVLEGPTSLAAGEVGTYTVTISGGAGVKGGFGVATSRSTANLVPGTGQKKVGAELTHSSAKSFSGGEVSFAFTMTAPPEGGGSVTIFASGNSTNGTGGDTGDKAAAMQLEVTIGDLQTPADAGTMEMDAGTEPDAGTGSGGENPPGPTVSLPEDDEPTGGCSGAGMALAPMVLGAWILHLRRRSRRQS